MYHGTDATEQRIARKLVKAILSRGFAIRVNDGEEWMPKRSTNFAEIWDFMGNTDMDTIRIVTMEGERVGAYVLVWGNGEDLISDSSEGEIIDAIDAELR